MKCCVNCSSFDALVAYVADIMHMCAFISLSSLFLLRGMSGGGMNKGGGMGMKGGGMGGMKGGGMKGG